VKKHTQQSGSHTSRKRGFAQQAASDILPYQNKGGLSNERDKNRLVNDFDDKLDIGENRIFNKKIGVL
jgi:hypothetical protein